LCCVFAGDGVLEFVLFTRGVPLGVFLEEKLRGTLLEFLLW
jgi:hypothetical protein